MNIFDEFEVILEADEAELEDSTESSWVVHTPPKRRQNYQLKTVKVSFEFSRNFREIANGYIYYSISIHEFGI